LPLVAGLGMTLVFSPPSVSPAATASDPARGESHGRRPPVVTVGAHIIFATATILFALLTAIGVG
jgi:hypothetical protein